MLGALAVGILLLKLFQKGAIGRKYPTPIIVYGFSCLFLFLMSGVYHLMPRDITARYVLRVLDHAGIFALIAGTFITLHLIVFSGLMKWGVIIFASLIAVLGITFGSIYFNEIPEYMTHVIFLAFGWLGIVSIVGLWRLKEKVSVRYLVYGGLAYTFGAIIDLIQFPDIIPGVLGAHELFHFAVLLGVAFHWLLVLNSIKIIDARYSDAQTPHLT